MKTKEYLDQIKVLDKLIDNKLLELEKLEAMATKVTSFSADDRVQTSGGQDKMANAVIKIIELKQDINAEIDRLVDLKKEILAVIDAIQDADMIDILYKRYFQYKKWEQIALEMHYTYQWICKLHGKALQQVERVRSEANGKIDNVHS